jgi:hypothetical protein
MEKVFPDRRRLYLILERRKFAWQRFISKLTSIPIERRIILKPELSWNLEISTIKKNKK